MRSISMYSKDKLPPPRKGVPLSFKKEVKALKIDEEEKMRDSE